MRSSKLEEDLQEEIMEKSLGEMAWLVILAELFVLIKQNWNFKRKYDYK